MNDRPVRRTMKKRCPPCSLSIARLAASCLFSNNFVQPTHPRKMIRIRSLATTYARDCVRSATAAGGSGYGGGGVRATVAARAFSSTLPSAQPPLPLDATGGDQARAEGLDETHTGQELKREEKANGVVELLQRHAQAVRRETMGGAEQGAGIKKKYDSPARPYSRCVLFSSGPVP